MCFPPSFIGWMPLSRTGLSRKLKLWLRHDRVAIQHIRKMTLVFGYGGEPELLLFVPILSFAGIGGLITLVDVGAFWILVLLGINEFLTNLTSFSLGATNSLLLNRTIMFLRPPRVSQIALFAAMRAGSSEIASKTFSIVVTFVVMFWLSRHFAFKSS
jgi:putative flippase GtrA